MAGTMYMESILEHYKNPMNFGKIDKPTIHFHETNPVCGDVVDIYIILKNGDKIDEIVFSGKGCAISQAASSMLTEELKRKPISHLKRMNKNSVLKMLGIEISAVRMKCALLGLRAAKQGLMQYLITKGEEINKDDFNVYE